MKNLLLILLSGLIFIACDNRKEISSINQENWKNRIIDLPHIDLLIAGTTYLPVYSQIYGRTEHITHDLTATISMRNTNRNDTIYIMTATYFNTEGHMIRSYFDEPIYLAPMETVEIIIDEIDQEGGTGANFLFDWKTETTACEPLFESVMISTSGQQGLSFTTRGVRIK